jgi:hypothetical protein
MDLMRVQVGKCLSGRRGHESAVERDLPEPDPGPVQLGDRLWQQLVLGRFPGSCPVRRINPSVPLRVFSVISQIYPTHPNSVGLPSLRLRIGRAFGWAIETSWSVIFSSAHAPVDLLGHLLSETLTRQAGRPLSFTLAQQPRADAQAAAKGASLRRRTWISRTACPLKFMTCAFASRARLSEPA